MTTRPNTSKLFGPLLATLALLGALASAGCSNQPKRPAQAVMPDLEVREVNRVLRGTIGAQATIRGLQPVFATGIGVVVDLKGTGGTGDIPDNVRTWLADELTRVGVGIIGGPMEDRTPMQVIDDPNTAVVLIEAAIPAAAPTGTRFDVALAPIDASTTSLVGGRLLTAPLYRGLFVPGSSPDTAPLASAEGVLFINPFTPPGDEETRTSVNQRVARVLGGGRVSSVYVPALVLDNPSHTRARAMVNAINTQFPQRNNRNPVARGRNEEVIEITVPAQWRARSYEFFMLLLSTRLERSAPDQWARAYTQALVEEPSLAPDLRYALRTLGRPALPFVRELYTHPDLKPRLTALEVGAKLGDQAVTPHLMELAEGGIGVSRSQAIGLLGEVPLRGIVDRKLREWVLEEDISVRVAAYEAMVKRGDTYVRRKAVSNGRFFLDRVPGGPSMIYFSMQNQPKLVVFGDEPALKPGAIVRAWDGRLLVAVENDGSFARVLYRNPFTGQPIVNEINPGVIDIVNYLTLRPERGAAVAGLGLGYTETISALHELVVGEGLDAFLVPETDRLALDSLRAAVSDIGLETRPELSEKGAVREGERFGGIIVDVGVDESLSEQELRERAARRARYVVPLRSATPAPEDSEN